MSYQSDMKDFAAQMKQRKQITIALIKLTSLVLAVALLAMTVLLVVDVLNDNGVFAPSGSGASSLIQPVDSKTVTVRQNGTISYKSLVTYPDGYELDWNSDNVDLTTPGRYTVTYTLTQNGKTVETMKLTVVVEEYDTSMDELMSLIEQKATALGITKQMSKVDQVRKIYEFVNSPGKGKNEANIYFNDLSNTGSDRSDWNTDKKWIQEAILTLQNMKGDCYSYYAVSKAFFEYFGIENVGIQRSASSSESGTHFWSIVNVGTEKDQWYYYDSTRLAGNFSDGTKNACLITQEKLNSYTTSVGGTEFYKMDSSNKYPTVSNVPLS